MKKFVQAIAAIRELCELIAVLLFLLYWPAANLYWVVCGALGSIGMAIGINSTLGGALGVISLLMAFVVPIWALAVIAIFYVAAAVAIISFRLVPFLLLLIAFLEWERYIPNGHVGLGDVVKMHSWEFSNWLYPSMYSVLAILGGVLFFLSQRRKPDSQAR